MDGKLWKALRILNDRIVENYYYDCNVSKDTKKSLKQVQEDEWKSLKDRLNVNSVEMDKPMEKINNVLEKLMKQCFDLGIKIGMKKENYKGNVAPLRNQTLTQIHKIYKECIPKEKRTKYGESTFYNGFNACIDLIKENMERVKGDNNGL